MAPQRCHLGSEEKRKPHHDLVAFKARCSTVAGLSITATALRDARGIGYTLAKVVEAIQAMQPEFFYKSMTSIADHTSWQDVYHVPFAGIVLYMKFTDDRVTEFKILSFKEK